MAYARLTFPRSADRGLIEAIAQMPWRESFREFPRSADRGLIEATCVTVDGPERAAISAIS